MSGDLGFIIFFLFLLLLVVVLLITRQRSSNKRIDSKKNFIRWVTDEFDKIVEDSPDRLKAVTNGVEIEVIRKLRMRTKFHNYYDSYILIKGGQTLDLNQKMTSKHLTIKSDKQLLTIKINEDKEFDVVKSVLLDSFGSFS